jgi:hypothetical protein
MSHYRSEGGGVQPSKEARPSNEGSDRWVLSMVRKVGGGRSWHDGV